MQDLKICNGWYLIQSHNQVLIQTDASRKARGAVCQGISTGGGQCSMEEHFLHINVLELKAIKLALLIFSEQKSLKAVHFQIDNTTALLYLVKMEGTGNQMLLKISQEIWQYFLKHLITITRKYLPSSLDVKTDWQSKNSRDLSEWKFSLKVFQQVCQRRGMPKVDLFTSRLSLQLPQYFAWKPDPSNQGTDALKQNWSNQFLYTFPPFCLILQTLKKVSHDQTEKMFLVIPAWQSQI